MILLRTIPTFFGLILFGNELYNIAINVKSVGLHCALSYQILYQEKEFWSTESHFQTAISQSINTAIKSQDFAMESASKLSKESDIAKTNRMLKNALELMDIAIVSLSWSVQKTKAIFLSGYFILEEEDKEFVKMVDDTLMETDKEFESVKASKVYPQFLKSLKGKTVKFFGQMFRKFNSLLESQKKWDKVFINMMISAYVMVDLTVNFILCLIAIYATIAKTPRSLKTYLICTLLTEFFDLFLKWSLINCELVDDIVKYQMDTKKILISFPDLPWIHYVVLTIEFLYQIDLDKLRNLMAKLRENFKSYFVTCVDFTTSCFQMLVLWFKNGLNQIKSWFKRPRHPEPERPEVLAEPKTKPSGSGTATFPMDIFDCPVCFEQMKAPLKIFGCSNDHYICSECLKSPRIKCCPICREDYKTMKPQRRYRSEHILAALIKE